MEPPKIRRQSSFVSPNIVSLDSLESELFSSDKTSSSILCISASNASSTPNSPPSSRAEISSILRTGRINASNDPPSSSSTNSKSYQNLIRNDKMSPKNRMGCSSCIKPQANIKSDVVKGKDIGGRLSTNQVQANVNFDGVKVKDIGGRLSETDQHSTAQNKPRASSKKVCFVENKSWAKSKWQEAVHKLSRKPLVYPTLNLSRSTAASKIPRLSSSFIEKKLGLDTDDKKEEESENDSGYSEEGTRLEELEDKQDTNSKFNNVTINSDKIVDMICNDKPEEIISLISNEKDAENLSLIADQILEIKELSAETLMLREKVASLEEKLLTKPDVNMLKERLTVMESMFEECSSFKCEIEEENNHNLNQIKALKEEIEEAQNYFRDDINEADEAKRSKLQLAKMMKTVRALELKIKKAEMLQQIIAKQKEDLSKVEELESKALWNKVAFSAVILVANMIFPY